MEGREGHNDAQLVHACLTGRPGAWQELCEQIRPLLEALIRRRLARVGWGRDDLLVEDLVAEVHLMLLENDGKLLRQYNPAYRLSTWLGVLVRTRVHRHLRKQRQSTVPMGEYVEALPDGRPGALERLLKEDARNTVRELLQELSARDRRILQLFYFEGLSYQEIATALDLSINSVGPILQRARGRLRQYLPQP